MIFDLPDAKHDFEIKHHLAIYLGALLMAGVVHRLQNTWNGGYHDCENRKWNGF